jgi:hypothetical protein
LRFASPVESWLEQMMPSKKPKRRTPEDAAQWTVTLRLLAVVMALAALLAAMLARRYL